MVLQGAGHDWAHPAHIYHSPSKSRHLGCKIHNYFVHSYEIKPRYAIHCNAHHSFSDTKMLTYIYVRIDKVHYFLNYLGTFNFAINLKFISAYVITD